MALIVPRLIEWMQFAGNLIEGDAKSARRK